MRNHCHHWKQQIISSIFKKPEQTYLWNYLSTSPTLQQLLLLPSATSESGMWAETLENWYQRPGNPKLWSRSMKNTSTEKLHSRLFFPTNSVNVLLVDVHLPQLITSCKIICSIIGIFTIWTPSTERCTKTTYQPDLWNHSLMIPLVHIFITKRPVSKKRLSKRQLTNSGPAVKQNMR